MGDYVEWLIRSSCTFIQLNIRTMKKILITALISSVVFINVSFAQAKVNVPQVVKEAFTRKFPEAKNVTWEREKGNYEANWGGQSGEDNSVVYSPSGKFVEAGKAIPVSELPAPVTNYVKSHYKGTRITEAMRVTNATGEVTYEAEVHGKDVIFDEKGKFLNTEKE